MGELGVQFLEFRLELVDVGLQLIDLKGLVL